jgi:hypothetical protein
MGSGGIVEIVWPTVWFACGFPTTDAQVASGDLGASQPFYFPLWPTYWGFKSRAPVMTGDTLGKEKLASAQQHSIRIYKLSKSYDKMTALKVRCSLTSPTVAGGLPLHSLPCVRCLHFVC